jgi:hypothetical protein
LRLVRLVYVLYVRLVLVRFGCLATFSNVWLILVTFCYNWSRLFRFVFVTLGRVGLCSVMLGSVSLGSVTLLWLGCVRLG